MHTLTNTLDGQMQQNDATLGGLIDADRYSDLMGEGQMVGKLDLGSAMISKVVHPLMGAILLISTDAGKSALIVGAAIVG